MNGPFSLRAGLDPTFLERMRVILVVLSCGFAVDVEAFREYAIDTARLYTRLYSWYRMSASVHKILVHGADFIAAAPLPIGLLSEEPLESRHKDIRHYRLHHVRLCSRVAGNTDLLHALLVSSDPVINLLGKKLKAKVLPLCSTVLRLLADPLAGNASVTCDHLLQADELEVDVEDLIMDED